MGVAGEGVVAAVDGGDRMAGRRQVRRGEHGIAALSIRRERRHRHDGPVAQERQRSVGVPPYWPKIWAVNVTAWPVSEGLALEVREVKVDCFCTVWVSEAELPEKGVLGL